MKEKCRKILQIYNTINLPNKQPTVTHLLQSDMKIP